MANYRVAPDSTIRLLRCGLRLDNFNQLTHANLEAQTNYFLSLTYLSDSNLSYVRKDDVIKVGLSDGLTFEDILTYNYLMYKNTHYENKWFYAYITNVRYINDATCEISFETDYFQTWQFDIVYRQSFIEREHVNNDGVGLHTVPENVEMGEYIANSVDHDNIGDYIYLIGATTKADGSNIDGDSVRFFTNVNGIPYAGFIYAFNNPDYFTQVLRSYDSGGYKDNVYAVWIASRWAIDDTVPNGQWRGDGTPHIMQQGVTKPSTINGYTPKNNKLFSYPYRYLLLSNNCGQANILHYEGWNGNCSFNEYFSATVGGDTKIVPTNYYGVSESHENAIQGGRFPTLSWSADLFTNWMSQNAVNIGIGQATSALSIVAGTALIATGAGAGIGAGLIAGGIGGIANSMMTQYQHSFDPTSARGNTNSSGLNVSANEDGFYFYHMSIKSEYAQIIDNYFSAYGYKVNRIGTPHIHVRTNWDFLKTINANLGGNIPEQDLKALRSMFDTGVTFWHNSATFLNYSATNNII